MLGLEICILSGNVSLCSVFALVSLLRFHSTMTPQILSAMLPSYWGVRGSSMPKVRGAHSDMHAHNLAHFFELSSACKLTCTTHHLYIIPHTAWGGVDGLDIWSWLTRRENEGELHREEKSQKEPEKGLVRQHAGRNWKEDPGSKKGDAKRKRKTGAERPKTKMCERKVRHRESQLFPISFSPRLEFSRISMLLLKDRTDYPPYLPDFNPVWWLMSPHVRGNESTARESCSSQQ